MVCVALKFIIIAAGLVFPSFDVTLLQGVNMKVGGMFCAQICNNCLYLK